MIVVRIGGTDWRHFIHTTVVAGALLATCSFGCGAFALRQSFEVDDRGVGDLASSSWVKGVDDLDFIVSAVDLFKIEIAGVVGRATFSAEIKLQIVIKVAVLLCAADGE